jgi:isochorismate synthase
VNYRFHSIIQACISKNLNFSVFSVPGSTNFELIIENPDQTEKTTTGFIFHPYEVSTNSPSIFISADLHFNSSLLTDMNIETVNRIPAQKQWRNSNELLEIEKDTYLNDLSEAIEKMAANKTNKFIYSRIKTVKKPDDLDLSKYLILLNETHKDAYNYLLSHPQSGTWIGASPETLVSWNEAHVSTMSLAGTQPYSQNQPKWSSKEQEEHNYVTKYIEQSFQKSAIPYETHPTQTVKAGSVFHLKTKINSTDTIGYEQAISLAKRLHPTPAICGVPLSNAKNIIRQTEQHSRLYYTGYLGFIAPHKKVDLFVNLRCLQVFPNNLALYLGGGITQKSVPENEWMETIYKSETLLSVLHSLKDD